MNDDVRIPDLEVRVTAVGYDLLVGAFYLGKNPHDAIEVVTSIYDKDDTEHLVEILQEVIKILRSNDWDTMDELDTRPISNKNDPPF